MRKLLLTVVIILGIATLAQATLIDRGDRLIYDTDLNLTWYDAPASYKKTWTEAISWADEMRVYSNNNNTFIDSWSLPTISEMSHLNYSELNNNYDIPFNKGLFTSLTPAVQYWSNTTWTEDRYYALAFVFPYGWFFSPFNYNKLNLYNVLAVSSGDVGAPPPPLDPPPIQTPEPATMLLLGIGLMGLAGVKMKIIELTPSQTVL